MAYISAEDVKAIRNELKNTFPKFKFGVRKMSGGSNGVNVTVKAGPTDFSDCFRGDEGYAQINHYHTHMYGDSITDEVILLSNVRTWRRYWKNQGWYNNSDAMTDYFDTAYYISMNVGSWDKPYEVKA